MRTNVRLHSKLLHWLSPWRSASGGAVEVQAPPLHPPLLGPRIEGIAEEPRHEATPALRLRAAVASTY